MSAWLQTVTGRAVDLDQPLPGQIRLHDIAIALARLPRYGGHTRRFYSVAEHSLRVAAAVQMLPGATPEAVAYALLHDAHEAYIGDITRPMRRAIVVHCGARATSGLHKIADRFDAEIQRLAGLPWPPPAPVITTVKLVDDAALEAEAVLRAPEPERPWPESPVAFDESVMAARRPEAAEPARRDVALAWIDALVAVAPGCFDASVRVRNEFDFGGVTP